MARPHGVSPHLAAVLFWLGAGLAVGVGIALTMGGSRAAEYYAAYFLEQSLSVDNMLAFLVIFAELQIPAADQGRVLWWGVVGALVFRAVLILAGITLMQRAHWILYPFGGLLLLAAWRMVFAVERERQAVARACSVCDSWVARLVHVSPIRHGQAFWFRSAGKLMATPLLVALVVVETTDVVFALDSIPAVLAITRHPLIVYLSNVMAMLGLRSLYFVLAGGLERVRYLRHGLGLLLVMTSIKMMAGDHLHVPPLVSVGIILGVLLLTVLASRVKR